MALETCRVERYAAWYDTGCYSGCHVCPDRNSDGDGQKLSERRQHAQTTSHSTPATPLALEKPHELEKHCVVTML